MAKSNNNFLSQIKWGESYTSLILGVVVVLVAVALLFLIFKNSTNQKKETGSASTNEEKTYTVKEGDDLWHISEGLYGSGYNWQDLAKANKISNPNIIVPGTKLSVPKVEVKERTITEAVRDNTITGNSYSVIEGDNLWSISIRAYGDGYKWPEVAKANNLQNPDRIYVGIVLKLPR
ncbi:MAG: hypothetical protein A2798_02370 [Candidatus Levybacteria bacterium RIFCSPHIGHO2_01_FULL_37_17]|nr:MAG: hypothetical protein A2798_02370 [Candidatus Levybacteria bacterium RIFCSPHIGHO2_01_FULL_37_17]OGH36718.1 MAG: hypothetical protein A2959_00360 [Candidatus Levybacteria bacterium RIFCSPLOWO2_01_FULL_38_23]